MLNFNHAVDGTFTASAVNTPVTVNVGFRPDRLSIAADNYDNANTGIYYYPYKSIRINGGDYKANVQFTDTGFIYTPTYVSEVQKHYYTAVKL